MNRSYLPESWNSEFPILFSFDKWIESSVGEKARSLTKLCQLLGSEYQLEYQPPGKLAHHVPLDSPANESFITKLSQLSHSPNTADWRIWWKSKEIPFRFVPGGQFMMGFSPEEMYAVQTDLTKQDQLPGISAEAEQLRYYLESMKPLHPVTLQPFLITEYPLTNKIMSQWIDISDPNRITLFSDPEEVCYLLPDEISHFLTQIPLRLPTEAEWEYACRAGTHTLFFWGNEVPTQPNTRLNALGIAELGNHVEICRDLWHENYHQAPADGRAWTNNADLDTPVIRGGAGILYPWKNSGEWLFMLAALRRPLPVNATSEVDKLVACRLVKPLHIEK